LPFKGIQCVELLIVVGNLSQMVRAEKLKEHVLKLVMQEGIHKAGWVKIVLWLVYV